MSTKKQATRLVFLDILNILAILAVLFMHHDFGAHYFHHGRSWFFDLALKVVMYFCIPVFLMCTGSTLLGYKKKYDTKTYFKKRVLKIVVPMVAWFAITGFFKFFIFKNLTIRADSPLSFASFVMSGGILDFYWYLFLIIGIYLTIPVLAPLSEKNNKNILKYAIITIFISGMVIPNIFQLFNSYYNQDLMIRISPYLVYPLIGYYLTNYNITKRRNRIILYILGVISIVYQFIITSILSYSSNDSNLTALGYTQFPTAIYASAIFCFVRNIKRPIFNNRRLQQLLRTLSSCSFGIYLIHYIVMRFEQDALKAVGVSGFSWIWRFACPFLTYALCVGIVLILKKIPFVRRIVP